MSGGNLQSKFFASLQPIATTCRLMGLQSPSITTAKPRPAFKDHTYIAFYSALYLFLSAYTLYYLYHNEDKTQDVVHQGALLSISTIALLQTMLVPSIGFKFRGLFARALRQMVEVDEGLGRLRISVDYSKNYRENLGVLLSLGVSIGLRVVFSTNSVRLDAVQKMGLLSAVMLMSLVKFQFVAVVNSAVDRFRAINLRLGQGLQVSSLTKLHFRVCHGLRLLNGCFGVQLVSSVFCSFCMILFQLYFLYTLVTKRRKIVTLYKVGAPGFYLGTEVMEIYKLVNACAKAKEHAERTPVIIHEIRCKYLYSRKEDQTMYSRSLELLHQKIDFAPLGVFKMDYYLIYQMIMAASAYSVVYIQYDLSYTN